MFSLYVSSQHLQPLLFLFSGEGLSSSRLSLLRRSSQASFDAFIPPSSPSFLFGRLLSGSASPSLYRYGRHLSEPCPPGLIPPLDHASSDGTLRRCSAPENMLGGKGVPEVVIHPPEEDMFQKEEVQRELLHQELQLPAGHTGKYLAWHGMAFVLTSCSDEAWWRTRTAL